MVQGKLIQCCREAKEAFKNLEHEAKTPPCSGLLEAATKAKQAVVQLLQVAQKTLQKMENPERIAMLQDAIKTVKTKFPQTILAAQSVAHSPGNEALVGDFELMIEDIMASIADITASTLKTLNQLTEKSVLPSTQRDILQITNKLATALSSVSEDDKLESLLTETIEALRKGISESSDPYKASRLTSFVDRLCTADARMSRNELIDTLRQARQTITGKDGWALSVRTEEDVLQATTSQAMAVERLTDARDYGMDLKKALEVLDDPYAPHVLVAKQKEAAKRLEARIAIHEKAEKERRAKLEEERRLNEQEMVASAKQVVKTTIDSIRALRAAEQESRDQRQKHYLLAAAGKLQQQGQALIQAAQRSVELPFDDDVSATFGAACDSLLSTIQLARRVTLGEDPEPLPTDIQAQLVDYCKALAEKIKGFLEGKPLPLATLKSETETVASMAHKASQIAHDPVQKLQLSRSAKVLREQTAKLTEMLCQAEFSPVPKDSIEKAASAVLRVLRVLCDTAELSIPEIDPSTLDADVGIGLVVMADARAQKATSLLPDMRTASQIVLEVNLDSAANNRNNLARVSSELCRAAAEIATRIEQMGNSAAESSRRMLLQRQSTGIALCIRAMVHASAIVARRPGNEDGMKKLVESYTALHSSIVTGITESLGGSLSLSLATALSAVSGMSAEQSFGVSTSKDQADALNSSAAAQQMVLKELLHREGLPALQSYNDTLSRIVAAINSLSKQVVEVMSSPTIDQRNKAKIKAAHMMVQDRTLQLKIIAAVQGDMIRDLGPLQNASIALERALAAVVDTIQTIIMDTKLERVGNAVRAVRNLSTVFAGETSLSPRSSTSTSHSPRSSSSSGAI
eukprot:TRINITY_DN8316_c0_g2_i1.p1 TRINITY_DN8316_c0_g2~~TRINITY_DN8316_c0_g2_i1.p1  ORF type:complete len:980 (+),score=242.18 TRINITY_DN8316_c0_g2_i1:360-2942(+)